MPKTKKTRTPKEIHLKKIEAEALEVMLQVARKGEGGIMVVGEIKPKHYSCLFPNFFKDKKISIFDKGMKEVLSKLAIVDGAVIIDTNGMVTAYGTRLTVQKTELGYGTRHSAAKGISTTGMVAILASEQDRVVRIFKAGKKIMEINPHTRNVEKNINKIVKILNSPEVSAIAAGAVGSALLAGSTAAVLPGVILFGGGYLISQKLMGMIKQFEF